LNISLETFGQLLDEKKRFSKGALERPDFEHDPAFAGREEPKETLLDIRSMERKARELGIDWSLYQASATTSPLESRLIREGRSRRHGNASLRSQKVIPFPKRKRIGSNANPRGVSASRYGT
jgi:hypothetical protein